MIRDRQGFDDLIFQDRNKEYGAYKLRRDYSVLVIISLVCALIIGTATVIIPYLHVLRTVNDVGERRGVRYVSVQMDKLEEPPQEQIVVPPAAPPPPSNVQKTIKYIPPEVVDTILPTEQTLAAVAEIQASPPANDNDEITAVSSVSDNEVLGDPNGVGNDEPFILVEVKPSFRGGDLEKFREWVQKRVIYPQEAMENRIQGKVYLTFVVERDGSVSTVNIVKGVDPSLDDVAKKAIEASPKWSPGLQRGRPVRVRFSIFLNFTL
jgi:protein TonB